MKNIISPLIVGMFLLASCEGSDTYRGDWKATDMQGLQADIHFEAKSMTLTHADGKKTEYTYKQNQVKTENGLMTDGIQLGDGRSLQVYFPIKENNNRGLILDANNHVLYTISRDEYLFYNDLYAL